MGEVCEAGVCKALGMRSSGGGAMLAVADAESRSATFYGRRRATQPPSR